MTSPDSAARPGRVAGLALLGIAAVALVIGVITLFGGSGDGQADGGGDPPATETSGTTGESEPPGSQTTSPGLPSGSTNVPGPTTTTPTSGPATTTSPTPGPEKAVPVRVYNNSTIKGLAAEAAEDLTSAGWQVAEVGNYSAGRIPTTTVYYTPGTAEEAAARAIAAEFGMRVEDRFEGIMDANPGVIVIVTNDYRSAGKDDK